MIKQMAWNTFKNTGDINSYLELVEVENLEKEMERKILLTEEKNNQNLFENIDMSINDNNKKNSNDSEIIINEIRGKDGNVQN